MIRAREGLMFADGSTLNVNDKGVLTRSTASGEVVPNVAGTGTAGRLAKWAETGGAGTLTDSAVTEAASGFIGVGTTSPQFPLHIEHATFAQAFVSGGTAADFLMFHRNAPANARFTGLRSQDGKGKFSSFNDNRSFRIEAIIAWDNATGDVGIGTVNPAAKLDVVGNINTSTQYNIGGNRVLSNAGTGNLFVGVGAGQANPTGGFNSFFGSNAGKANTVGRFNSFFGDHVGDRNTTGEANSFFGHNAGALNISGNSNSFFGAGAGGANTTGENNVFVGAESGSNVSGNNNTLLGFRARVGLIGLTNATAIGAEAEVDTSNSLILGTTNVNVGIGTRAPTHRLTVGFPEVPVVPTAVFGVFNAGGAYSIIRDTTNNVEALFGADNNGALYGSTTNHNVQFRTNNVTHMTIEGTTSPFSSNGRVTILRELKVNGLLELESLGSGTDAHLCIGGGAGGAGFSAVSSCSSSIRYKEDVSDFTSGLDLAGRLRPVSFRWKKSGRAGLGLIAEDVERVEPRLVTRNAAGEVEGVNYDRLGVVLLNAVQEQQAQIKEQQQQLRAKDARIADLETHLARYDARLASLERSVRRTERMARRRISRANWRR